MQVGGSFLRVPNLGQDDYVRILLLNESCHRGLVNHVVDAPHILQEDNVSAPFL